jgi:hypothetical protein
MAATRRTPRFCAALDQARLDAGLAQWLAEARAFDAAISAKFSEVAPPPVCARPSSPAAG